ncbi:MAG: hypothetical protein JW919_04580 [Candidatus Omnitrophica bacterium]|nr:hypothetical protein [Candidatus Omnitrophota bacterium]
MKIKENIIIILLVLIAIALYMNSLNGRYEFIKVTGDDAMMRFDTRSGNIEKRNIDGKWEALAAFGLKENEKILH